MEGLQKMLDELTARSIGVEDELSKVRAKMIEAKKNSIVRFKGFDAYKMELNLIIAQFLAKERVKIKRLIPPN